MSLVFDNLSSDGDSIGLALSLPNGSGQDYSGAEFVYNEKTSTYTSISSFTDGISGKKSVDDAWLCSSVP